jgi:endo-1,4-beta-D-glucanase Y
MRSLLAAMLFLSVQSTSQVSWPLWSHYAEHFVHEDGRVVDLDRDELTTSEGQSYAMFFALVANDGQRFDLIYRWTQDHLAAGSLKQNLPAWSWGRKADGDWGIEDNNSASDADMWLAYDLIQAGRLWKRSEYSSTGKALLSEIALKEVVDVHGSPALLAGKTGFERHGTVVLNPSYMPLFLFEAAARTEPGGPWTAMANSLPSLLHNTSIAGFAPDWVAVTPDGTMHAIPAPNSNSAMATGSYDAIRIYLWAGITSPEASGRDAVLSELSAMTTYMRKHSIPPESVSDGQMVVRASGPIAYSAALIPFLLASQAPEAGELQERRLNSVWSSRTGLYGQQPRYYDQNLSMFTFGYLEHRYRIESTGELEVPWQR